MPDPRARLLGAFADLADSLSSKRARRGMDAMSKYGRSYFSGVQPKVAAALRDLDQANEFSRCAIGCREAIQQIDATK